MSVDLPQLEESFLSKIANAYDKHTFGVSRSNDSEHEWIIASYEEYEWNDYVRHVLWHVPSQREVKNVMWHTQNTHPSGLRMSFQDNEPTFGLPVLRIVDHKT